MGGAGSGRGTHPSRRGESLTVLPGSMSGLSRAMVMQLRKMKTRTT